MNARDTISGQCLCGTVLFQLTPPLDALTHCHCRSCRLSRGVAFVTWTAVPPEQFAFTKGESDVLWYRSSPGVRWGSCRRCASPMFYVADQAGHRDAPKLNHIYVSVGSLTGKITERAVAHVSYEEHVGWIEGVGDLPKFRGKTTFRLE
jgi:hypothetical protein